jgi:hypothetical protein
MSLGQVAPSSHESNHGFPKGKEVFTDAVMDEGLDDEAEGFQALLDGGVPNHRQSPLHFRGLDAYEIETSYSSEDSTEVFATEGYQSWINNLKGRGRKISCPYAY